MNAGRGDVFHAAAASYTLCLACEANPLASEVDEPHQLQSLPRTAVLAAASGFLVLDRRTWQACSFFSFSHPQKVTA